jgi:ubiquinone/menaquinone biosynthesis C-methylase UbiE
MTAPGNDLATPRERADAELARILRCPGCRGPLEARPGGVRCAPCAADFRERDGFLDLVLGSSSEPTDRINHRYDRGALIYDLGFRFAAPLTFRASLDKMREFGRRAGEARVVLDLPAGTGSFLPAPGKANELVVACDLSRSMLARARARIESDPARLAQTRFVRADVMRLPFERASFDAVNCLNGLHVFPDAKGAARELARVKAPGALAAGCAVLVPTSLPRRMVARLFVLRSYMTTLFTEPTLRALLVESGLARDQDIVHQGDELYWESRV